MALFLKKTMLLQTDIVAGWQTGRQTGKQTDRHAGRQADRRAGRQTGGQGQAAGLDFH